MTKIDLESARLVLRIATSDPVQSIEAAKRVIKCREPYLSIMLADVAGNSLNSEDSRIAAVYALGFQSGRKGSAVLLRILRNTHESVRLRSHAAEALGNRRETRALDELGKTLMSNTRMELKESSIYAISEIGGSRARGILRQFESGMVKGRLKGATQGALQRL